ncbi:MAG TPA: AMP-binding protein [Gemmatimonadaceae bacterium]|nr:AMP-binding protein [Gemmatimonadaceae bacterium]
MTDPLSLLTLACAAAGGRVDDYEAAQLVAAGVTLLQRSAPLVRALSGRRSAILLPTSHAFLTALAASDGRGAVLVNPLAAPAEIEFQITDAGVGAVFTNAALARRLPPDVPVVLLDDSPRTARVLPQGVAAGTGNSVDLGAHFGLRLEGSDDAPGSVEEAAVVYTSAMAGTPLGAVLTHRNLLANARSTVKAALTTGDDHALALLPFAHLFGLTVTGTAPLVAGARVTTMERFQPVRAVEILETTGITQLVGVPAVFGALLTAIERRGGRLAGDTLRLCICGGAVLPVEMQDRWFDATGVELRQGYGLTEAAPVCLFNRVDLPNRRGTLGVPFPDVEVEIRSPRSRSAVTEGEEGEICVRGDNVSPGYVRSGELGLRVEDGWLRTGDLGARNADGTVSFRGLLKPMFTRNGFNIYPREIERVVAAMPGVRSIHVRAIPEPTREHDIALDVDGDVTSDAVKAWCEPRLSAYKQPSEVKVRA